MDRPEAFRRERERRISSRRQRRRKAVRAPAGMGSETITHARNLDGSKRMQGGVRKREKGGCDASASSVGRPCKRLPSIRKEDTEKKGKAIWVPRWKKPNSIKDSAANGLHSAGSGGEDKKKRRSGEFENEGGAD